MMHSRIIAAINDEHVDVAIFQFIVERYRKERRSILQFAPKTIGHRSNVS